LLSARLKTCLEICEEGIQSLGKLVIDRFTSDTGLVGRLGNSVVAVNQACRHAIAQIKHQAAEQITVAELRERGNELAKTQAATRTRSKKVALVIGRDEVANEIARKLIAACGLEAFEFPHAKAANPKGTQFNHEIVSRLFKDCDCALVVRTPDEIAKLESHHCKSEEDEAERRQERPNVLLEYGMALGHYGEENVLTLQFGFFQPASDHLGLHAEVWDPKKSPRNIYERFKGLGLPVDSELRKLRYQVWTDKGAATKSAGPVEVATSPFELPWISIRMEDVKSAQDIQALMKDGYQFYWPSPSQTVTKYDEGWEFFTRTYGGQKYRVDNGSHEERVGNVLMMKKALSPKE
jgi:predicted nucleotide-binding protein